MSQWITHVPNSLIRDTELSLEARFMLVLLKSYASGRNPKPFPGIETLCALAGRSEPSVRKYLDELEAAGLISRDQRRNDGRFSTNLYTLTLDSSGGESRPALEKTAANDHCAHVAAFRATESPYQHGVESRVNDVASRGSVRPAVLESPPSAKPFRTAGIPLYIRRRSTKKVIANTYQPALLDLKRIRSEQQRSLAHEFNKRVGPTTGAGWFAKSLKADPNAFYFALEDLHCGLQNASVHDPQRYFTARFMVHAAESAAVARNDGAFFVRQKLFLKRTARCGFKGWREALAA